MPRVTSYALEAELMPLSDRKNLHQLDAQERGKNARRIISYRFCYVRPTPHDILLAQRQAAIRDAQVKPAISGSARSEPRDAIDDIARRSRITRALAQAEEDLEQEKAEALEAGRLREERQARLNNAVVKSRGYKGEEGPKEGSKDWAALKYRELRAVPVLERLAVRRSHIHGWGLYTKVDVERDDFIIECARGVPRRCLHFNTTRLQLTMPGVVSFSSLRPFRAGTSGK